MNSLKDKHVGLLTNLPSAKEISYYLSNVRQFAFISSSELLFITSKIMCLLLPLSEWGNLEVIAGNNKLSYL